MFTRHHGATHAAGSRPSAHRCVAALLSLCLLSLAGCAVLDGSPPAGATAPSTAAPASTPAPSTAVSTSTAAPLLAPSISPTATVTLALATPTPQTAATPLTTTATVTATTVLTTSPTPPSTRVASPTTTASQGIWPIRSVDTMKLSRDTLKMQLTDRQIAAVVRLDARLRLSHITVDVYYDDPSYLGRWVRAVRAAHLHVWFRSHWYAWENHRDARGTMAPQDYISATRRFLQDHAALLENGDIFDFCPEPENGAYWQQTYGKGWSWRSNAAAKRAFNTFMRSGVAMAASTLAHRGRSNVMVTVISVNSSVAQRLLSQPTVDKLGQITLDLYPEGATRDPATAARLLMAEVAAVRRHWNVPILLGEHGYARDQEVDDATQARVLAAELTALARLPYLRGMNYWVDAGGRGHGGYTNIYRKVGDMWQARPAADILTRAYATATPRS